MISLTDAYHVVAATVPLYVAMILAYISVKWWKLFTPDQCSGINKFVAKFSIPLLSFQVISTNNPYKMNMRLVCADFLQKLFAFSALVVIMKIRSRGNLSWIITGLSLSTLPNTLILGIPILRAMYGDEAVVLLTQIVVLQSIVWYNVLLFLFEVNMIKQDSLTAPTEGTGEMEAQQEAQQQEGGREAKNTTPKRTKFMPVLLTVGKKLITNPNTHATVLGLIWATIHFRWGVQLPKIMAQSISILSDGGLGMAMFSVGLFMASRANIIACGTRMAVLAMAVKFIAGPALMAVSSIAVGLRGTSFRVAIMQLFLKESFLLCLQKSITYTQTS
ncbi:auxin efflux carrier component 8 isoform X2 [Rhododendron vialii]|uniref:auxin efflux carrier component 8 isoform X2 n=1 Tax=Rhododendron vialii TaxID=182163 RepID=UPI00265E9B00|nr:auxin efflux carrier component 8 isoform X2 [Rhododendron vialii]